MEFMILTAARTGQVRGAVWSEFDFDDKTWTIPAKRMTMKREHRVPLCDRAVAILEDMGKRKADDRPYVFPGQARKCQMARYALF